MPLISLLFLLPIFFYKLNAVSLSSWDEAWYGVIARNIYLKGDLLNLVYNNRPFYDHPPFGFWLQNISFHIFGINDFSVRFFAALLGFFTLIVVYLLGKEIFGKLVGFFSAIALASSPWFLYRARSGNLDIPLTFLFVLSFYFIIKASKNIKYLYPLGISLAFLFLTKSLVPFTIIPVLLFVLWKKIHLKDVFLPFLLFLAIVLPWFVVNQINNPELFSKYLAIGYPGTDIKSSIWENIELTKTYLHNGIGIWFWYGGLSLILGFIFYRIKFLPILLFISVFLFPFMFSSKGHIWHLIPVHPFWILALFGFLELVLQKTKLAKILKFLVFLIIFVLLSFNQIKRNWYEIINVYSYKTDIAILSEESAKFNEDLYLDDDAIPETIFYSGKERVNRITGRGGIRNLFDNKDKTLLITRDWRLIEENINPNEYTLILKDRDKVLILKK